MNVPAEPVTVFCRFVVHPEREAEMRGLLAQHWPTLHRLGLTTDEPARLYEPIRDAAGGEPPVLVEVFIWKDVRHAELAHHDPEVMRIWEPMGACCRAMEFPHFRRVSL